MLNVRKFNNINDIENLICGIKVMDEFLHSDSLSESLIIHQCESYTVIENEEIIAFFALDMTTLELDDDYKVELLADWLDAAKPEFNTQEELEDFLECNKFDVVDIAYLAVSEKYQRRGYGSKIMSIIFDLARKKNPKGIFITVDALNLPKENYSAAPFYEKFGFQRMQPPTIDTIRMFCTIYQGAK